MLFSKHFSINRTSKDDWFDPILDYDTRLFLDPYLVFKKRHPKFRKSHERIIAHFENVFRLAAQSPRNKNALTYKKLITLNKYPEVEELCLGYSGDSTRGAGSGNVFSEKIVAAVFETIDLGLESLKHFEELGIFHKGIGADRISDITANIIKMDLIKYTNSICQKHSIPTTKTRQRILNAHLEWETVDVELPINPINKKKIILVPATFLNDLPEINDDDFYNHCVDFHSEELRIELNTSVLSKIRKEEIIEIAQNHRNWVSEYIEFKEKVSSNAYDLAGDPLGIYQWINHSQKVFSSNPFKLEAHNNKSFHDSIEKLIGEFKLYIEENGGYKLLWDYKSMKGKHEEAAQLLFYGVAKLYCKYSEIDINRESDLGRGPVDFKFSNGYSKRILLEMKLARNSKFWNGLNAQFPSYLKSASISTGYFMVICYSLADLRKVIDIEKIVTTYNNDNSSNISVVVIDACDNKPSASNIKPATLTRKVVPNNKRSDSSNPKGKRTRGA